MLSQRVISHICNILKTGICSIYRCDDGDYMAIPNDNQLLEKDLRFNSRNHKNKNYFLRKDIEPYINKYFTEIQITDVEKVNTSLRSILSICRNDQMHIQRYNSKLSLMKEGKQFINDYNKKVLKKDYAINEFDNIEIQPLDRNVKGRKTRIY